MENFVTKQIHPNKVHIVSNFKLNLNETKFIKLNDKIEKINCSHM